MAKKPREGSRDIEDGILISTYPDYCRLPGGAVVPYIIWARQSEDGNTAPNVRMTGKRSHTTSSVILRSHGDEAGRGGGVKSGTVGGICQPKTHSPSVRIEKEYAVRHDDEWWMNNKNTIGKLQWIVKPMQEREGEEEGGKTAVAATMVAASAASPVRPVRWPALPPASSSSSMNLWWNKAGNMAKKGAATAARIAGTRALPLIGEFFSPSSVADGTLTAALQHEADVIAQKVQTWRESGMSPSQIDVFHDQTWEALYQLRPELFQEAVWGEVFPAIPMVAQEKQEDSTRQKGMTAGNVRVTARRQDNSCMHLACLPPVPGSKYRGGAYFCMAAPSGDRLDAHHMPAQGYGNHLAPAMGPAVQMEPEDHQKTASHPRSRALGKNYDRQAALLQQGQNYEAFKEDVKDMLHVEMMIAQPGKYLAAVAQAAAYMECLKQKGYVK